MMPLWTTETCAVHVRMRVALGRAAVRRPARVADAGASRQGLLEQALFEIAQLAFGAAAFELAVLDGRDARLNHSRGIQVCGVHRPDWSKRLISRVFRQFHTSDDFPRTGSPHRTMAVVKDLLKSQSVSA